MPQFEDRYHWSFIVGPKEELEESMGTKFHVKNFVGSQNGVVGSMWQYEETEVPMAPVNGLLVRILIAKVKDEGRLQEIFRGVPIRPSVTGWNCVGWVKEAVDALASDPTALGSSATDWVTIRNTAMGYVEKKHSNERFGKNFDSTKIPTWDLIMGKEVTA
ncbi:hypothetical protein PG985_003117 [Apiospora marii]|uniref:uncharacterized protein n=1 Tax=Apiospora marii TaxID=335849 RepID=UPI00312F8A2F